MYAEPRQEHRWLDKLVGEWTFELVGNLGPDQTPAKSQGTEVVRSLGGLWTIAEGEGRGEGDLPMEGAFRNLMTLGYDPKTGRFVGTFVASMTSHLWTYSGALDKSGTVLALETEGPSFTGVGTAKCRDNLQFLDDDQRTMTSDLLGEDGRWHRFMTAHYRRKT